MNRRRLVRRDSYVGPATLIYDGGRADVHCTYAVHLEQVEAQHNEWLDGLLEWRGSLSAVSGDIYPAFEHGTATLVLEDGRRGDVVLTSPTTFAGNGAPPA